MLVGVPASYCPPLLLDEGVITSGASRSYCRPMLLEGAAPALVLVRAAGQVATSPAQVSRVMMALAEPDAAPGKAEIGEVVRRMARRLMEQEAAAAKEEDEEAEEEDDEKQEEYVEECEEEEEEDKE